MSERFRSFFFSTSLGALPKPEEGRLVTSKIEPTTSVSETNGYNTLIAGLTVEEKAQFDRIHPFVQKLISHIQQKYSSPEFAGIIVQEDRVSFSFPEKLTPVVLSIFANIVGKEYQRALDAHNAEIPPPKRVRPDLHKLN